jgi:hypothetical protein
MTAAGSFTDFHFDIGGTSVWYHVLRGHKVRVSEILYVLYVSNCYITKCSFSGQI